MTMIWQHLVAAENGGFSEPIDTLTESDPVSGLDAELSDFAAHDVPSESGELPKDFNEIEDSSDVISEQRNNQLERITRSLKDIW